jgi:hypothetical protein
MNNERCKSYSDSLLDLLINIKLSYDGNHVIQTAADRRQCNYKKNVRVQVQLHKCHTVFINSLIGMRTRFNNYSSNAQHLEDSFWGRGMQPQVGNSLFPSSMSGHPALRSL